MCQTEMKIETKSKEELPISCLKQLVYCCDWIMIPPAKL